MSSTPHPNNTPASPEGEHKVSNFLRQIIEKDRDEGTYATRRWGGTPGDAAHQLLHRAKRHLRQALTPGGTA